MAGHKFNTRFIEYALAAWFTNWRLEHAAGNEARMDSCFEHWLYWEARRQEIEALGI
jgi:hypothetical protein